MDELDGTNMIEKGIDLEEYYSSVSACDRLAVLCIGNLFRTNHRTALASF